MPQGDDKIIEHESYLENEYLYPLNPIILCFVTPENLRSRFEIKQAQNTYQVFKNYTKIIWVKKEYVLRKEYLEEEVINKFNQPTACSVWPNFPTLVGIDIICI